MICDSVISVIMCDEIIKRTKTTSSKTFPLDFNEKGNLQNKLQSNLTFYYLPYHY